MIRASSLAIPSRNLAVAVMLPKRYSGGAWHSTAQHGTVQRIAVQHGTALLFIQPQSQPQPYSSPKL